MQQFQPQIYKINDIVGWNERKELFLSPKFQRRAVWSPIGKSYLIDSIINGYPLPQFFIREEIITKERRTVREVVDGQQRLRTILEYINDEFVIMPIHNVEYSNIKFSQLSESVQQKILSYPLSVNVLIGTDDSGVLQIFSRLNAYSVPLNEQEKINAEYLGVFKQKIDFLANTHLAYWERNKILNRSQIARMKENELTSELVITMIKGLQNGKKPIRDFYKKYDASFEQFSWLKNRFSETLEVCSRLMSNTISETEFSRTPLFYSLFSATYDLMYGLKTDKDTKRKSLIEKNIPTVQQELLVLNDVLSGDKKDSQYEDFLKASKSSTDKLPSRTLRHQVLKDIIKLVF